MSIIRVYKSGQPYFNNQFVLEEHKDEYIPIIINKKVKHRVGNPNEVQFVMDVLADVSYVMHKIYRVLENNEVHWNTCDRVKVMR